ncbi:MAG: integrin alpha [Polyangiales bacterium]
MRTISLALLVAGCNPGEFQDYLDTAPIRVSSAPDRFDGPNFGETITTVSGQLDGASVSRVVASAGGGSPLAFIRSYGDGKVSESTFLRCKNEIECSDAQDIGAVMIPFERWGGDTNDARQLCVFSPANATRPTAQNETRPGGNGYVACEAPSNRPQSFTLGPQITDVRDNEGTLRFSGFGLPPEHPLGVVMLGVHSIDSRTSVPRNGGLYLQPDLQYNENQRMNIAPFLGLVPLLDPTTGKPFSEAEDAADFGAQVAGAADGNDLTFAIAQPSKRRVIVGSYDDGASGDVASKFRVHACLASDESGFGAKLAVGDLTGDGVPEIVVATKADKVLVYDGRSLPGPATGDDCPGWDDDALEVGCDAKQGPSCDSFGSAIAIGDVDADGKGDLIVGGPRASVGGTSEVGAVWIVPGDGAGLDTDRTVAITVPGDQGAHFGFSVAALRTKDRDEPVASAPGIGQVFTLMCTPLESGFGGDKLCLD